MPNVWKFVKNRILEEIANNKLLDTHNNECYKTVVRDFLSFELLMHKTLKTAFIKAIVNPKFSEISESQKIY